jgi:hypothetical protein
MVVTLARAYELDNQIAPGFSANATLHSLIGELACFFA